VGGVAVRAYVPGARSIALVRGKAGRVPMQRIHDDGVFEVLVEGAARAPAYRLEIELASGHVVERDDPYRFKPVLSDFDLHLLAEGTHHDLAQRLGAHVVTHQKCDGVAFAVWAPSALRVSVIGSFNGWNGRAHPMRQRPVAGVWELFVPGLGPGSMYKFEIRSRFDNLTLEKADPCGAFMELRPNTASIVLGPSRHAWQDGAWMSERAARQALDRPMAIYEVHVGSWRRDVSDPAKNEEGQEGRFLSWLELADTLVPYVAEMGFTHLELLPVTEHPYDGSWGYQTTGYFAPTSRLGTPDDFRTFVDAAHRAGLGVLLDWVPAHFPKDAHGLGFFDGSYLYEHADPRKGHHPDWGTAIFNYGRPPVAAFLLASALHWLEHFHVDGLRVDAVASMLYLDYSRKEGEWLPNAYGGRENLEAIEFLKQLNVLVHQRVPGILMSAEESTSWPGVTQPVHLGGLGFDLKWNLGWMHDTLEYFKLDPVFRRSHQGKLTFSLSYAWTEKFLLPLSHDEVVHGKYSLVRKMPGDLWRMFANLRALYGLMYAHPGKKLLFMGAEIAQFREWSHDRQLDWDLLEDRETGAWHRGVRAWIKALNRTLRAEPALHEVDFHWDGFQWIDFRDVDQSVLAFVRRAKDPNDFVVVVANLTPVPRAGYRIGVPKAAAYRVLLNSDTSEFGGMGASSPAPIASTAEAWHGQDQSIALSLPPLSVVFLKPVTSNP
jgi:1,4-alpha-glucan branching enzyme